LTTHEDAKLNLEIAETSRDLAKAAKEDARSMKTIAIMTMAFLPGTYFAALWAVPSLDWNVPNTVQDSFWIYWAFTVPFTGLVFGLWYILSYTDFSHSTWRIIKGRIAKLASE
jgi:Mg2+ and Co2+ transporter CorA